MPGGAEIGGVGIMRNFLFGVILGAFGMTWAMGALPEPVENFLNDKLCALASVVGIDADNGADTADESDRSPGASTGSGGSGSFEAADALRRGGVFQNGHLVEVYTCPGMAISNEPPVDADDRLKNFRPLITVQGVSLAAAPVSHGCFSSGFGDRDGKLHRGVDYHSEAGSTVYSAGSGTIVEVVYRDDYGNMVVIDHGNGVYTRYAHLKGFASGITQGKSVTGTTKLGQMGQSAGYRVVVHLHYELLLGDFNTPAKSFGLEPKDLMAY